ncbi:MAG: metallophosphoesterase [Bryobacteraceae bacterium]
MDPFGILHLSDLHCKSGDSAEAIVDPLRADLSSNYAKVPLQFVVISGDFIDKGDANGFSTAAEFCREVSKVTKVPLERFVVCPGNHDVEDIKAAFALREEVGPGEEEAEKLKDDAYRVRVLSEYPKRFSGYSAFCKEVFGHDGALNDLSRHYPFPELGIQFVTLNSACRIDNSGRKSRHRAGGVRAGMMTAADAERQPLRIAVWHHAVLGHGVAESDGYLQRLAEAGFAMLLHGDVHETRAQIANCFRDGLAVAGAGSPVGRTMRPGICTTRTRWAPTGRVTAVHVRKQEQLHGPFDGHTVFGKKVPARWTIFRSRRGARSGIRRRRHRRQWAIRRGTAWHGRDDQVDRLPVDCRSVRKARDAFPIEQLYVPLTTGGSIPPDQARTKRWW